MRILWLSHLVPYPPKGGVLQRSHHLLRETAREHEVDLISFVQRDLLARRFPSVEHGLAEAQQVLSQLCRRVEFFPIPSETHRYGRWTLALASLLTPAPYTINWLRSREFRRRLQALATEQTYDLIHVDTISLAPYRELFPQSASVLDHHNIESHMMLRRAEQEPNLAKRAYYWQEGLKLARYERRACARVDLHITCSDLDSQRLREIVPHAAVEEVPNGVDVGYFTPTPGHETPHSLIFAGGLNWYPNHQAIQFFADQVWPLLKAKFPDVIMNVVGEAPPEWLRQLAVRDSNFRVHGFVDDVRVYLNQASVYVCPITDGGGTKLKVLDAFAMAKPVVSHPVACEGIDAVTGRHVLFATTPTEYVAQIELLFRDAERRQAIAQAARQLILDKYSYASIGARLRALYQRTAKR